MQCHTTALPGVLIIEPRVFEDHRGFFFESYFAPKFAEHGITTQFVQDNHSRSQRGTLRGLHYQIEQPQAKLCRVVVGAVIDVCVDIRLGSPTFGQWVSVLLTAENKQQIFVPRGFAHGFYVISEVAEFLYKCDNYYAPQHERGVVWNDADLSIDWHLEVPPVLSRKDAALPRFAALPESDLPRY